MEVVKINYIRNPKTIKLLAEEIKKITDDYWTGKTTEEELKSYIHYTARNTKLLTDKGKDINNTIKIIIGQKRTELIFKMLENHQMSF